MGYSHESTFGCLDFRAQPGRQAEVIAHFVLFDDRRSVNIVDSASRALVSFSVDGSHSECVRPRPCDTLCLSFRCFYYAANTGRYSCPSAAKLRGAHGI